MGGRYVLETRSVKPAIMVTEDPVELAQKGAGLFVETARACAAGRGICVVAISGGSTPRAMHRLLAKEPFRSQMPWANTHVFWVDERVVAYDSPDSNYGAAKKDLLENVPVPAGNIHPMPVDISPEKGAERYQKEIGTRFHGEKSGLPSFDLVFLGIGQDGHTASLFPGQGALDEQEKWVVAVKGGTPDVYRLTLTLPILNSSREIVFVVSGKEKALAVKKILENGEARLPAQRVAPTQGKLTWLLDQDAASLLSGETVDG